MKTTDVLGCAGAVIAIFLATSWIPFLGPLISLLTPLPFLFYASKSGHLQGALIVAFSLLIIGLIAGLLGQPKIVFLFIEQIYPALMVMGTALVAWANVMVAKVLFRKAGLKYPDFGALNQWSAPVSIVWIAIAAGFASFFPDDGIKFLAINLLVVLAAIYTWQGLMIMMFFFNQYRISTWI